ncbi:MAG TPA: SH3 domain-containing protein [Erythrobacter sp.]|nr:SH3 domain-containing protein [Erythrobacter sp.]
MIKIARFSAGIAAAAVIAAPLQAKDDKGTPELVRCSQSIGSIALVEGDQAGWTEWGLGSPRALINALAAESGCFTIDNPNDSAPARFLVTAIAGSAEEVDQGMEVAKGAATEALVRSGAASGLLRGVPGGGAMLGMFGGLGGKKKTVAAGLRVVSPANGMTVAVGQGTVKKSSINFGNASYGWAGTAANASGYQGNKNGEMLTEAFVLAFNQLVAQRELMASAPQIAGAAAAEPSAVVAVDTVMRSAAAADASAVRSLRAGTELDPTGNRAGLFIEVKDNFGTTGWVSVEDLR